MFSGKTLRDLQVLAMWNIEADTMQLFYRRVCRWYSREFNTPLPQVEDLSPENVLMTYFEEKFSELYDSENPEHVEKYEKTRELLLMSDHELKEYYEQQEAEEEDVDDWEAELVEQVKKGEGFGKLKPKNKDNSPDLLQYNTNDTPNLPQDLEQIPENLSLGGEDTE